MPIQAVIFMALLGIGLPADVAAPSGGQVCVTTPAAPKRVDAQPFESTAIDGTRTWGATATYQLSTGALGEAFMVLSDDGSGEAQFMIDGEIIAHVAIESPGSGPEPVSALTTWLPASVSASPDAIAEMMQVDLPVIVAGSIPQEFKCSDWGRKVMKAGRYIVGAGLAAAAGACCAASKGLACSACAAGAWTANEAVGEFANGYCD
jgi:hypothetical protein